MRPSVKFTIELLACVVVGPIVVVAWTLTGAALTAWAIGEYVKSVITDALAVRRARQAARRQARRFAGPEYRLPEDWWQREKQRQQQR